MRGDTMKMCRKHNYGMPCWLCNIERDERRKQRGGRDATPLTNGYGSTKDQGGRGSKRQTNKNHDTNRRGGRR